MATFQYLVTVDTDTAAHAAQVIAERIDFDEAYEDAACIEFDYTVTHVPVDAARPAGTPATVLTRSEADELSLAALIELVPDELAGIRQFERWLETQYDPAKDGLLDLLASAGVITADPESVA